MKGMRAGAIALVALLVCAPSAPAGPRAAGAARPGPPESSAAGPPPLAIVHGTIIDGRGGPPIVDGTVVVRGGRIESVGPSAGIAVPKDARIIEARGKSVLPGLADLHVHLTGGWDGVNIDFLGYQRYLNSLLYAGVTTVLDTGNNQAYILQMRQEVAQGRLLGPRIYCTGAMIDGADPAWPDLAYAVASTSQIPGIVQRDKQAGVDLIKGYANLSIRLLQSLTEAAGKAGLRVVVDQWDRNGSPDVARAGIAGFAHLPTRVMSPEDIQVLKEKGLFLITTLAVNESFARPRFRDHPDFLATPLIADTTPAWLLGDLRAFVARPNPEETREKSERYQQELRESMTNARKLHDAGLLLGAGTDAPYPGVFHGEGLHRELELLVASGLTPLQAIRAATYDAARILKAEEVWGSLQPGRRADVLVVAGNPAERIGDTRAIEVVIKEGVVLDRKALRFDPARDPDLRPTPGIFVE